MSVEPPQQLPPHRVGQRAKDPVENGLDIVGRRGRWRGQAPHGNEFIQSSS